MADVTAEPGAIAEPGRLATWRLAAYAAPQLALAALYFPVLLFALPVYAIDFELPLYTIGAVLIAIRLFDAASDPAMGWLSDRVRTRFGRRKIWLVIATPLACLSTWMAFNPPEDVGVGYIAFWLAALALSWTVAITPYLAWGAELATDYEGRARVSAWREGAQLLGALAAAGLFSYGAYTGAFDEDGAAISDGAGGLSAIALFVVVALPLLAAVALVFAPEPIDRGRVKIARGAWRALRANRPFWRLIAAQFINSAADALPAALAIFYAQLVLKMPAEETSLLLGLYFIVAAASPPLWAWASKRLQKHQVWSLAMAAHALALAFVPLLGPGDYVGFIALIVVTGLGFGADLVLPPAIQADVVDVDTAESRSQRTGLYFAVWSFGGKVATAIIAGVALMALGDPNIEGTPQDPSDAFLTLLVFFYAAVPILLKAAAIALMWRFPLGRAAQEELRREIEGAPAASP